MGLENVKCFECQQYGHLSKDCPEKQFAAELGVDKPPWCFQCDRETRLVYFVRDGVTAARKCYTCHPNSQTLPAQFAKCRACRAVIYQWDIRSECGRHTPVGRQLECLIVVKAGT